MSIKVFLERENQHKNVELSKETTVRNIMTKLNVNCAEVITVINNELATEEAKVKQGDDVKFLAVISGG